MPETSAEWQRESNPGARSSSDSADYSPHMGRTLEKLLIFNFQNQLIGEFKMGQKERHTHKTGS